MMSKRERRDARIAERSNTQHPNQANNEAELTMKNMKKFLKDSKGASMVEYALLLFAVLIVAAVAVKSLGPRVSAAGTSAATELAP
jgi:Flp pilus assembly pilin Flp